MHRQDFYKVWAYAFSCNYIASYIFAGNLFNECTWT